MPDLPAPVLDEHSGFVVVRDDLVPGGTKRRMLDHIVASLPAREVVYASPAFGYAQIALAHACSACGKRAVVFTAKRSKLHPCTGAARDAGAAIRMVEYGRLSVVQARAWSERRSAFLVPFGGGLPLGPEALTAVARAMPVSPSEVWTVAGSGTLSRALQAAWPEAVFHAVRVGAARRCDVGRARLWVAKEEYEKPSKHPPPFPSSPWYDAKAWVFMLRHARPGALFWNVGA